MLIRPIENSIARNSFILPPSVATKKSVHLNLRRDQNERSNFFQFWLLSDKREFVLFSPIVQSIDDASNSGNHGKQDRSSKAVIQGWTDEEANDPDKDHNYDRNDGSFLFHFNIPPQIPIWTRLFLSISVNKSVTNELYQYSSRGPTHSQLSVPWFS